MLEYIETFRDDIDIHDETLVDLISNHQHAFIRKGRVRIGGQLRQLQVHGHETINQSNGFAILNDSQVARDIKQRMHMQLQANDQTNVEFPIVGQIKEFLALKISNTEILKMARVELYTPQAPGLNGTMRVNFLDCIADLKGGGWVEARNIGDIYHFVEICSDSCIIGDHDHDWRYAYKGKTKNFNRS